MKKWLVLLIFPMACTYYEAYEPAIHGLGSPIQLAPERTAVWLSDYFPKEWKALDSIQWPNGLQSMNTDSGVVWLNGIPSHRISTAHFYQKGIRYDIPVIASAKKPVKWIVNGLNVASEKVNIFGTFNAWNKEALSMQKEAEGQYSVVLYLQDGSYEYKLWADGLEWIDPSNPDSLSNGMGGYNSVIRIEVEGVAPEIVYPISHGKNFVSLSALPEKLDRVLKEEKWCTIFLFQILLFGWAGAIFAYILL
jgi:cyclomaltodextrinase / maltogenic alpha-amylase / neopullulanase